MHIGFDAKRYFYNRTGLGNYSRSWINQIHAADPSLNITLFTPQSKTEINSHLPVVFGGNLFWRTKGMGEAALRNGCDLFHGLSNEIPVDLKIPAICTIHDVIFKEIPSQYAWFDRQIYHRKTAFACKNSAAIITTSQTTSERLKHYYKVPDHKLFTIYQSVKPEFENIKWSPKTDAPYLIYHSSFNLRKNHKNLIEAFAKIATNHSMNLVLAGSGDVKLLQKQINQLGLQERVSIVLNPSDEALIDLLQGASGFVYPSFQEGFGIPLVEAAYIGMPMVVSDIDVFQELSNAQALHYFNPYEVKSIADGLEHLIQYVNTSAEAINYKATKSKTNSQKMVKEALEIYSSVL